ncbi:MAG: MarR family winged helix-turn-helix transcriptional regulator [Robiginitomaculum sp.]
MPIARPTHRRLFAVFDHAHGRLSRCAGKVLVSAGVKPAQATALIYLGYHDGAQPSEMANGVGINNAATTGLVSRMEKAELVIRKKLLSDGRGKTVHLTAKGLRTREKVMDILRDFDDKLAKNFTESEMDTVYKFLRAASELKEK